MCAVISTTKAFSFFIFISEKRRQRRGSNPRPRSRQHNATTPPRLVLPSLKSSVYVTTKPLHPRDNVPWIIPHLKFRKQFTEKKLGSRISLSRPGTLMTVFRAYVPRGLKLGPPDLVLISRLRRGGPRGFLYASHVLLVHIFCPYDANSERSSSSLETESRLKTNIIQCTQYEHVENRRKRATKDCEVGYREQLFGYCVL